jgi:glycosyltransferase involved in cell wall biosynthesis
MVNIALDATPLTIATGGLRRYTDELSRALAECYPADDFWLLSDQLFDVPARAPMNLKAGRMPRNVLERRWWLWGLQGELARLGIAVFHGTDFAVPYLGTRPSVLTLHDLSPWRDERWHHDADRVRRRTPLLLRLGLATMIITPSEAVRKEAVRRFGLASDAVVAVPHAASAEFRPVPGNGRERPYFLYVGTLEPRKNIGLLLDVWREVRRHHDVELVLAGRRRQDFQEIPPEPGLRLIGSPPDEEVCRLYSGALAVLYPTFYEGFGLPVLEAMQCGAAVVASRDPAVAEVAGSAAILLDAQDSRAWAELLNRVAAEPDRFQNLRSEALVRAAEFTWANTARRTRAVYDEALRRFRKS